MKPITQQEITDYVEVNIQVFHHKRLDIYVKLSVIVGAMIDQGVLIIIV